MRLPYAALAAVILVRASIAQTDRRLLVNVAVTDGYLSVGKVNDAYGLLRVFAPAEPRARAAITEDLNAQFRKSGRIHCASYLLDEPCPGDAELDRFNGSWTEYAAKFAAWKARDTVGRQRSLCEIFTPAVLLRLLAGISAETGLVWGDEEQLETPCGAGELKFQVALPVRRWAVCDAPCAGAGAEYDYVALKDPGPRRAGPPDLLSALKGLTGRVWRAGDIRGRIEGLYADAGLSAEIAIEVPDAGSPSRVVYVSEGARIASVSRPADDRGALMALYYLLPDTDFRRLGDSSEIAYPEDARPLLGPQLLNAEGRISPLGFTVDRIPDSGGGNSFGLQVRRAEGPARSSRIFAGGAVDYRPGQGFRGGPKMTLARAGGRARSFSVSGGGGAAGGTGNLEYAADFVGFGLAGRRKVSLNAWGGTQADSRRFFSGSNADERRWEAGAGATVEWFRDRRGQWLRTFLEARRTTVTLMRPVRPDEKTKLGTLDAGAFYLVSGGGLRFERQWTVSPRLHAGIPVFAGTARFGVGSVTSEISQSFPKRYQARVYAGAWFASARTPLVELPSFGGAEVARGFRADEAIGHRMWSVRGEFWMPLPERFGRKGGVAGYLREALKVAPLADAGGLYRAVSGRPGTRVGAGGGLRVRVQSGVYLKLDYAHGFYAAPGRPRGRFYFGVAVDPR